MFVIVGRLIHSTWEEPVVAMDNMAIGVRNDKIVFIRNAAELTDLQEEFNFDSQDDVTHLSEGEFLIPGFIDTHIHASQYTNAGKGLDLPLLEWLQRYTFPTEARYQNMEFAQHAYDKAVKQVLQNGTTTACYFGTIHEEATLELCRIIGSYGQRALVGKVCMNQESPPYYIETTEESLTGTRRFIGAVKAMQNPLIQPIATPRFAVSCDEELLSGLGSIASETGVHIQSHLSEQKDEVALIHELYPDSKNYADVYHRAGLLTDKTIMAHGVYLTLPELETLKAAGTAIAHCPNSNMSLCSGMCDVRRLLDYGVKVGLGTDMAGGFQTSMLDAIRMAAQTSNLLFVREGPQYKRLGYQEAFRLATLGGAQALAMDSDIGNFEVGKQFDALRINPTAPGSPFDIFDQDSADDVFQKFIYLGDNRNIREVYVAGNKVHDRATQDS